MKLKFKNYTNITSLSQFHLEVQPSRASYRPANFISIA